MPKLLMNFEEILLCAHENFEEQNKALKSSIIIINYCINAQYNCIINAHYYSPCKRLKECNKEENVEVAAVAATSCFRGIKRFVQWHVFDPSPPERRPSDTYTLCTAPDLCKNVSILFGSNCNSYMISTQSGVCTCRHLLLTIQRRWLDK